MKLPVIGGFTQAEGVAMGAFTTSGASCSEVRDVDISIHGVMLEDGARPFVFHSTPSTHNRAICNCKCTAFRCATWSVLCMLRVLQDR